MRTLSAEVAAHYSRFLGETSDAWWITLAEHPDGRYRILTYKDKPCQEASTLATLGLSDMPLHMFRQELLFLCYDRFVSDELIALIAFVAGTTSESMHPLLHGSVLPPAGPLLQYTKMDALYIGTLLYFDNPNEEFDLMKVGNLDILISWLIPIHSSEAEWIAANGWEAFESLIVEQDPDLLDLERAPIV